MGSINALGFDSNDLLFGAGLSGGFYTLNTSNGFATLVADISGFVSAGDIVFNPDINKFLATSSTPNNSTLFSIALDGTTTQIGDIGFGNVFGLFFENGTLFGYTADRQQITIDLTTGAGTFDKNVIGGIGQIFGAASLPSTGSKPVPEPLTILGVGTALSFGTVFKRRLSKKQQKDKTINS